jgi:ubiquitin-conjugating enzyme E2 Z
MNSIADGDTHGDADKKEIITLTKETVMRLVKDVKELIKTPLTSHGIYYEHNESDMLKGKAMIIGPKNTPYEGGFYLFEFKFPTNYPHSPPKVKFCTGDGKTRFNPNLYKSGKVCLSVLNTWTGEQWTGCQTISSILLALCTVLNETPLLNEPGIKKNHKDFDNYNKILEYKNIEVAIYNMIKSPATIEHFPMFMDSMKQSFLANYDIIIQRMQAQQDQAEQDQAEQDQAEHLQDQAEHMQDQTIIIDTRVYNMSIVIDYNLLKSKIFMLRESLLL